MNIHNRNWGLPYAIALLAVILFQFRCDTSLSIGTVDLYLDHAPILGRGSLVEASQKVEMAGFDANKAHVDVSIHVPPSVSWLIENPRQVPLWLTAGIYAPRGDLVAIHEDLEV